MEGIPLRGTALFLLGGAGLSTVSFPALANFGTGRGLFLRKYDNRHLWVVNKSGRIYPYNKLINELEKSLNIVIEKRLEDDETERLLNEYYSELMYTVDGRKRQYQEIALKIPLGLTSVHDRGYDTSARGCKRSRDEDKKPLGFTSVHDRGYDTSGRGCKRSREEDKNPIKVEEDNQIKCITSVVREGTTMFIGDAKRVFFRVDARDEDGELILSIMYE